MNIKRIWAVYFSPTDTTGKIVKHLAGYLADRLGLDMMVYDYTLPGARESVPEFSDQDLVVWGTPVYAGRVPNMMIKYVASVPGNGAMVIPVVTYGNRSFQDGLSELRITFRDNGFVPVAAAAFVTSHCMSDVLGAGRPSEEDFRKADAFTEAVADDILAGRDYTGCTLTVPGNDPVGPYYRPLGMGGKPVMFLKAKPVTKDNCDQCGICASVCPMGSISHEDPKITEGICIKCQACIRKCPQKAKYFDDANLLSHIQYLEMTYTGNVNEPEFFRA